MSELKLSQSSSNRVSLCNPLAPGAGKSGLSPDNFLSKTLGLSKILFFWQRKDGRETQQTLNFSCQTFVNSVRFQPAHNATSISAARGVSRLISLLAAYHISLFARFSCLFGILQTSLYSLLYLCNLLKTAATHRYFFYVTLFFFL